MFDPVTVSQYWREQEINGDPPDLTWRRFARSLRQCCHSAIMRLRGFTEFMKKAAQDKPHCCPASARCIEAGDDSPAPTITANLMASPVADSPDWAHAFVVRSVSSVGLVSSTVVRARQAPSEGCQYVACRPTSRSSWTRSGRSWARMATLRDRASVHAGTARKCAQGRYCRRRATSRWTDRNLHPVADAIAARYVVRMLESSTIRRC